ncbi:MAG TPA: 16S rRNA (cytidine(1402)-2'-O)-methyltransferase [Armatimonadota bacterium]|nr:16S rRNA (cytidine(1402)-2'-O)-methyltransferase [Armatimonadota bacterium]
MPGTLYIVGTPIGNLEDMTFRAVRILREVDIIAAEDTRVTAKLLAHFDIDTHTMSYHRHSGAGREEQIVEMLREGKNIALVSDAGMPGISDPGQPLISLCVKENIAVVPVPGPSSVITALAICGFNTDRFHFLGFLPRVRKDRLTALRESLIQSDTCAAFEAPHRVAETLADFATLAPEHPMLLARELTKKFEELRRGTAAELAASVQQEEVRGEIVLAWPGGGLTEETGVDRSEQALQLARKYRENGLSARDAADKASAETGVPRRPIYQSLIHDK